MGNLMSILTDTPLSITVWVNVRLRLNPRLMLNSTTTPILDTLDILTLLDILDILTPLDTLGILTPLDTLTALTSTTSTTVVSSRERLRLRPNLRLMPNT